MTAKQRLMWQPIRPVAALVLVFAVAAPPTAAEPTGETLGWTLIDCRYVYVTAPIPSARLQPSLPDGFEAVTLSGISGQPVSHVAFEMEICESGTGLHGSVSPMIYAQSSVPVVAPPEYRVGTLPAFVKFHPLIPDADRRTHLRARGVPAFDGTVTIGAAFDDPAPGRFDASTVYDGIGEYRFHLIAGASDLDAFGEFIQYLEGDEGSLSYWRTTWIAQRAHRTVGTVTLPPDSWEAEAFGTTTLPVRGIAGIWSYPDGKLVLPS